MLLGHVLALVVAAAPPSDLSAVGIVMSARAEARTALLQSGGRTRVVGIGDTAFGGRVAAIESDHVAVDFDSGRVRLRLVTGAGTGPAVADQTMERTAANFPCRTETSARVPVPKN